ncbi:MAG TPA: nuclear transport factor 2 family protein [Solirubrobacteraceae bacterium]|nr:nuclear transport factor 2 family protein [Solirubrobacteraceae bacterium]
MSRPDMKIFREVLQAFNDGDVERILSFAHPDFEASIPPELSAEPDTYRGHAGLRRYFASFAGALEEVRFELQRLWDAGDAIVLTMRLTARGERTSIPVEQRFAQVWTWRDGLVAAIWTFVSLSDALEAAGLPASAEPTQRLGERGA